MKQEPRPRKPTKHEAITLSVTQNFAHAASTEIMRRRSVLEFAATQLQAEIIELNAKLAAAKIKLKEHEAKIAGFGAVIAKR